VWEGTHRQLGAGLDDRLAANDPTASTDIHQLVLAQGPVSNLRRRTRAASQVSGERTTTVLRRRPSIVAESSGSISSCTISEQLLALALR